MAHEYQPMSTEEMEALVSDPCSCGRCVAMCHHRPCWPTPIEAQAIMDAGHSERLMLDYYADAQHGEIEMVVPAIVGHEKKLAPFWPTGTCAMLDGKLCVLHDLGLKPLEGRIAHHEDDKNRERYATGERAHRSIALLWASPLGESVVTRFRGILRNEGA